MRIISPFKDFYDHASPYYSDNPVYVRVPTVVEKVIDNRIGLTRWSDPFDKNRSVTQHIVFVAGLKLPSIFATSKGIMDAKEFAESSNNYYNKPKNVSLQAYEGYENINEMFQAPVVCFSSENTLPPNKISKAIINSPIYEFSRFVNPAEIYQRIEMWLSREKDVPIILNNEERLEKAGFDKKVSFRHRK